MLNAEDETKGQKSGNNIGNFYLMVFRILVNFFCGNASYKKDYRLQKDSAVTWSTITKVFFSVLKNYW